MFLKLSNVLYVITSLGPTVYYVCLHFHFECVLLDFVLRYRHGLYYIMLMMFAMNEKFPNKYYDLIKKIELAIVSKSTF